MFTLYVDGSCSGNGNKENFGGMGIVLVKDDKEIVKEYSIPAVDTTNNRMEMSAIIYAIGIAKILNKSDPREIIIYSDSSYCVELINKWMYSWVVKGWKKSDKKTPENLDLVKELYRLMQFERAIKVQKIKGHNGDEFNERADYLATSATEKAKLNIKNMESGDGKE